MLATRIIPVILFRGTQAVKGKQFNSWRSIGHVEQQVRIYQERGCDEIILLDIAATPEGRGPDFALIERLTRNMFMPLTVGGGVKTRQDVQDLLNAGADKVAVCTGLCVSQGMMLLQRCADRFGCQVIVAAVDHRGDSVAWECGRVWFSDDPANEHAAECEKMGAGEIMLTSIDRDGMMEGYDLDMICKVSHAVSVPVIAAGGCGTPEHMLQAIQAGASAVAAGAMFAFTDTTPKDCARYLREHGVEVRCD